MGENNSVSFALELLQLFCKINTSSPWTSKVYARAYHRLIWRFLGRITNDPIVGRLTRSLPLSRPRGPPVHVARAPARLDSVNSESILGADTDALQQRRPHCVDRWLAIEPDGKRERTLMQQHRYSIRAARASLFSRVKQSSFGWSIYAIENHVMRCK